jgi:hypothetical protein
MTSLDNSLDYTCIVEDSEFPIVKLCRYTSNTPRKTELLSNELNKGDIFALIQLEDAPTFDNGSWISISLEEIRELDTNGGENVVEIIENYNERERNQSEHMGCALCNSGMNEAEQYRLIYGYHIVNFHETCFEEFKKKLVSLVDSSQSEIFSHTV